MIQGLLMEVPSFYWLLLCQLTFLPLPLLLPQFCENKPADLHHLAVPRTEKWQKEQLPYALAGVMRCMAESTATEHHYK
jgi:hypothetical protein